eukprot:Nitzschia sp. Nitz4//scaffold331_size19140//14440//16370//NITZ4_008735-RA/size19140-augustus-gene-0.17-mRNA-1//-1//CDS//3329548185//5869//frame0
MKHKKQNFNKYAWASRLTAPVIKVDLIIQCKDLPKKDLLSQADSFCVLWQVPNGYTPSMTPEGMPQKLPGRLEMEMGRTEVSRACVNPTFKHKFRLEFSFHQEQSFIIRVYDEDLRYATDLKEHDYLGGCVFTLGQLMGAKGCTLARKLARENSYMLVFGDESTETREVLEFRFSCQDLIKEQSLIDQSKVLDKSNPFFRLERLNKEDQSWEVIWKSEVIKDSLNPTWMESRLPLQLLCNDDHDNPLKITIWDYEKHSSSDLMGFVESTVSELVGKAKEHTVPVMLVKREKKKLFGGSKLKTVGLLKVLKASVVTVPSMLQYLGGGCSLDVLVAIDCSTANGAKGTDKCLHHSASHWLNDYQAGIQKLGSITENFARGRHSSVWGFGAKMKEEDVDELPISDGISLGKELLASYDKMLVENPDLEFGEHALLRPLLRAATFKTIRISKQRQCYLVLCVFTAGDIEDLESCIELMSSAAEDAPVSLVIVGVGNKDFTSLEKTIQKLTVDEKGRPIGRELVSFVSFKQFAGNAAEVIGDALKDVPEQFVTYFANNGTKPMSRVPPPDFEAMLKAHQQRHGKHHGRRQRNGKSRVAHDDNVPAATGGRKVAAAKSKR